MKTYLDIDCIRLIAVAGVKITPPNSLNTSFPKSYTPYINISSPDTRQIAASTTEAQSDRAVCHIRTQSTGHNLCDSLPARPALTLLQHYTCKSGLTISHIALSEI